MITLHCMNQVLQWRAIAVAMVGRGDLVLKATKAIRLIHQVPAAGSAPYIPVHGKIPFCVAVAKLYLPLRNLVLHTETLSDNADYP